MPDTWKNITDRGADVDANAAADINAIMANLRLLKGGVAGAAPSTNIEALATAVAAAMSFAVAVQLSDFLYVADAVRYLDIPFAGTLTKIYARVGTCETGDTVDIDVRKKSDGNTILNADISIAQDAYTAIATSFAVTSFSQGDRLLVDINGCTIAKDLQLTFVFTKS